MRKRKDEMILADGHPLTFDRMGKKSLHSFLIFSKIVGRVCRKRRAIQIGKVEGNTNGSIFG